MIRINIPGFSSSDSGGPRWGDAQIIDDGTYYEVIDGYCGVGTTKLIKQLKAKNVKNPYLYISHAHYDHYYGIRQIIRDSWFKPKRLYCYDPATLTAHNNDIRENINALKGIIKEAESKGIPVSYLKNGMKIKHGDISFSVYREQPGYAGNSDAYLNDGSLCFYFPELSYWTSGDGPDKVGSMCEQYGCRPKLVKIPHHGNACPREQAKKLYALGARYCWDNDYNTKITDFLQTGREDCIGVGMQYFSCHGDLNMVFAAKRAIIYKGSSITRYTCSYTGGYAFKGADLEIVKSVLAGKLGNGDTRITNLLNMGYNPGLVQKEVNAIVALLKK